jgi:CRP/FNR family transcriptional regulator
MADSLPNISGELISFKKGESPIRIIGPISYVFLIVQGAVELYTVSDKGNKLIAIYFGEGDIFPISWIINKAPEGLFFKAKTDCTLVQYSRDELMNLLPNFPELSFDLLKRITSQFGQVSQRVINLQYPFVRERLASRLIILAEKFGIKSGDVIELPFFNQTELASSINVTRESVSRELTRLKKKSLVSYEKNKLKIFDMNGLYDQLKGNLHSVELIDDMNK